MINTSKLNEFVKGFAIGDAFGAGVEFQDRNWIAQNVDFKTFVNARSQIKVDNILPFIENYHPWNYTDDTEMLLAMIHLLNNEKEFTEDLIVKYIHSEYQKGIEKNGFGRNGHGSMSWYFNGSKTMDEIKSFQQNRPNPGNAPCTRAVILGFLNESLINQFATINANATHPHPKAIASSIVVARATYYFLNDISTDNIYDYCIEHIVDIETINHLKAVSKLPDFEKLTSADFEILCGKQPIEPPMFLPGINGLPSDALLTAGAILYILKYAENAFDALKKSVLIGGDVDSLASVCTGIFSPKYGLDSIPQFMLANVEKTVFD